MKCVLGTECSRRVIARSYNSASHLFNHVAGVALLQLAELKLDVSQHSRKVRRDWFAVRDFLLDELVAQLQESLTRELVVAAHQRGLGVLQARQKDPGGGALVLCERRLDNRLEAGALRGR